MKQKLKKYYGFTVIELLTVTVILGIIVPSIMTIYSFMIRSNREFSYRQSTIQQGYEFFEKLNVLMQDYTIDYEEYYNRQMVGCVDSGGLLTGENFKWNIGLSGYCTEFTAYGNENSTQRNMGSSTIINGAYHDVYNCTSGDPKNIKGRHNVVAQNDCGMIGKRQSFGQYKALFIDANVATMDEDDVDLGKQVNENIKAIMDSDNIQELYLISHDGKNRLFFRRKLNIQDGDLVQYKIQMLRLRGFDAGQKHNFDETIDNEGLYDGQMDTWACDTSMGFIGGGNSIGGAYTDYHLPDDGNDCWVDLTYGGANVHSWNISLSPLDDPDLYWADQSHQINPYMKIMVVNGVYSPNMGSGDSVNSFKIPIETAINMNNFYRE